MRHESFANLAECTEFRQTLQARPPRVVHGTLVLLVLLLATAVTWAGLTRADLVVRAPGRVRPVSTPVKVFSAGRGEVLSASAGGRVIEVRFREGDEVREGDVLVRLDTERLDNEITKRGRIIQAGEAELATLARLRELSAGQLEAARAKIETELAQARTEIRQARERQGSDLRLAQVELTNAQDEERQLSRLAASGAVARNDLIRAVQRTVEAREKLEKVQLPVDDSKVEILQRSLTVAEKDHAARREEIEIKQATKQAEVETARLELANLELEKKQAVLLSPTDGIVTTGDVKVGDILEPGKPVVEIARQEGFVFEAAVPSEEVGHLRERMPARLRLDAYDYQKYGTVPGQVAYVSPDSSVVEGRTGAFYLVRITVKSAEVGRGELHGRVKLGMAGTAEVVTDQDSLLWLLVKKVRRTISLG